MASAALELQAAIFAALSSDAELVAALGGQRIHDHVPADAAFPYLTFGRATAFDWSTDDGTGTELLITIHAWSKARGRREALALIELVRARLHDAPLAPAGHRLVSLRAEQAEAFYLDDIDVHQASLRLRALAEQAD